MEAGKENRQRVYRTSQVKRNNQTMSKDIASEITWTFVLYLKLLILNFKQSEHVQTFWDFKKNW